MSRRLIVSGWRYATEDAHGPYLRERFDRYLAWFPLDDGDTLTVVHGQCPYGGVDKILDDYAVSRGHQVERNPARTVGGRLLGGERNVGMARRGAEALLGFPGPPPAWGTWSAIQAAWRFGIPAYVFPLPH